VIWYDNGVAAVPEPYPAESRNGDNLALAIRKDVLAGTLPEVSWVVTNQLYSEHRTALRTTALTTSTRSCRRSTPIPASSTPPS